MTSIRTILSLVVVEYLHLEQLDVKIAFPHGDLEEEIGLQVEENFVWPEASSKEVVFKI